MKRTSLKSIVVLSLCTLLINTIPVQATTVSPGETFTVNLSCGVMEGSVQANGSNASIVNADNFCNRNTSVSVTAVAGGSGTATISLVAIDVTNTSTMTEFSGTVSSVAVSIANATTPENPSTPPSNSNSNGNNNSNSNANEANEPEKQTENKENTDKEKDKNTEEKDKGTSSYLSTLGVSNGTLSPKFQSDIHEYTLDLDNRISTITVDAESVDAKASVSGTGEKTLELGENKIEVICTAEDGSSTTYTIVAKVSEKPAVFINYGTAKLGVLSEADTTVLSNAFSETTITVDGQEIKAWRDETIPLTLVYLVNDKQEKDFYIYEEGKGAVSIYRPIALCGKNLVMIDIPQELRERSDMNFGAIQVDHVTLQGWTFDDETFKGYSLIYMMDQQGNKQYYQYEETSNSLQQFSGAAAITQKDYDQYVKKQNQSMLWFGVGTGVLGLSTIILLYTTILFYRRKGKGKTFHKKDVKEQTLGRASQVEVEALKSEVNENKEDF